MAQPYLFSFHEDAIHHQSIEAAQTIQIRFFSRRTIDIRMALGIHIPYGIVEATGPDSNSEFKI